MTDPSAYTLRPRRPWGTVRHLPGGRTRFPLWVRVWRALVSKFALIVLCMGAAVGVVEVKL
jgi:hypothetical protein